MREIHDSHFQENSQKKDTGVSSGIVAEAAAARRGSVPFRQSKIFRARSAAGFTKAMFFKRLS